MLQMLFVVHLLEAEHHLLEVLQENYLAENLKMQAQHS